MIIIDFRNLFQYPQPPPRDHTEASINKTMVTEDDSYGVCNRTHVGNGVDQSEGYAIRNHKYYWMFVFG